MARSLFGGGVGDQVFGEILLGSRTVYGEVTDDNGDPAAVTLTVWSAATAGTQLTDLLAADGTTPITEVVTSAGDGQVPLFYGPDAVTDVYVSPDEGDTRYRFATGPAGPTGATGASGSLGGLTATTNNMIQAVASAWASRTPAQVKTALAIAYADITGVQASHANLTALAGLSLVADRLPYANGTGTLSLATLTSFVRTLLDDTDAATFRATLGAMAKTLGGAETKAAASGTSGTVTLDCSAASVFSLVPTGNVTTLTLSNPPASGLCCTITLFVVQGGTPRTIATPTGGIFLGAATPTQVANKTCAFTYITYDGGTIWHCSAAVQV